MNTSTSKRKRVKEACLHCRRQKVKCDGVHPTCGRCADKGLNCSYMPVNKNLKYTINGPVKEVINKLTEELATYQKIADKYKLLYQKTQSTKFNILSFNNTLQYNSQFTKMIVASNGTSDFSFDQTLMEICNKIIYDISIFMGESVILFDLNVIKKIYMNLTNDIKTKELEQLPFECLLKLWENAIILCYATIALKLEAKGSIIWKQIQIMLKITLWQKDYTQYPHLIDRLLFCFLSVSRLYSVHSKVNSSASCVLIAHRIAMENSTILSRGIFEQIHIFLLLSSNTRKERLQRIELFKKLNSQSPFKIALFYLACCLTGLKIFGKEIDSSEYDELLLSLYNVEEHLEKSYIGQENALIIKACLYALRAELSYRTNSMSEGNKWIKLCTDIFYDLESGKLHQLFYIFFGKLSVFHEVFVSQIRSNIIYEKLTGAFKGIIEKHGYCMCNHVELLV